MSECKYCHVDHKTSFMGLDTGKSLESYQNSVDGFYIMTVEDTTRYSLLRVEDEGGTVAACSNDINYCPMCGKKLTEVQE